MRKFIPVLLLLSGLWLLLYPSLSSYRNSLSQRDLLLGYREAVSRLDASACQRLLEAAQDQNDPTLLAVAENGIIGYVTIPLLQTMLPIYIGTNDAALRRGTGLLEGSSLPLGAAGCHSVLSAHRGLPEARLFRDLDRLTLGDSFTVTVLNRQLSYRVDQIRTVTPQDIVPLLPREGENLCTLLTCTPYGVNSHRLLVRGRLESVFLL